MFTWLFWNLLEVPGGQAGRQGLSTAISLELNSQATLKSVVPGEGLLSSLLCSVIIF